MNAKLEESNREDNQMSDRAGLPASYDQDIAHEPEDEGCPHMRARKGCEQCDREAEIDLEITARMHLLAEYMVTAETRIRKATGELDWLLAVDVELGEGDGPDARDALAAAGSALRNAQRVIKARAALLDG